MKLIACHIDNFGKLSDVTLQFTDGLNVINEANAWGKSTLAAFLKAMFYGLDAKKAAGDFEKERVMYRPWQGGAFGGELDFEARGKQYRISRSFGRTEKTDEFHLYDLSTNLESHDFSQDIGSELFELDSTSFKRSIYIVQSDCSGGVSDGIHAKLGNLVANTDDINNFESANQQLKELLNQLTPDRVTGSIKRRKNYITQLTQELRSFEAAQTGVEGIKRKAQQVAEQMQELLAKRKNYAQALVVASEDSRKKALSAQYEALCNEVEQKAKKRDAYKPMFPQGVPTEADFQEQLQYISQKHAAQAAANGYELSIDEIEAYSKLKEMFAQRMPTEGEIDAALEMFGEIDNKKAELSRQEAKLAEYKTQLAEVPEPPKFKGQVAHIVLLVMGLVMACIGLASAFAWYYNALPMIKQSWMLIIAVVATGCGAFMGLSGCVTGMRVGRERETWQDMMNAEQANLESKAKALKDSIAGIREDVRLIYSAIDKFLGNYHVYCEVSEYQSRLYEMKNQVPEYLRLKEKKERSDLEHNKYVESHGKIQAFASRFQFTLGEEQAYLLNQLQAKAAEYRMAEEAYQDALARKQAFEEQQDKTFWTRQAACPYSLEELNGWIAQMDEQIESLNVAKRQYAKQLEDLQEQLDLRDEKEIELKELHLEQEKDIHKYNLLKVTQDFLQQAKAQFTARYMAPIAQGFGKYYQMLTGDSSGNWMIDANINLKIKEQGELRETHWLSAGYQDLIGVCMRLALVDAMYEEEKPFLILDDPYVNLDQEKVEAGNKLLLDVAKEYQVIYFTCHNSRCP